MSSYAKAIQIADNVYWVGGTDWSVRDFHGYQTSRGSSYNAFLIVDEKITLIDTVKKPFFAEMRERIASVIDPKKIDYIVSCHAEMDHSGALPRAIAEFNPEQVYASVLGVKALKEHFEGIALTEVKNGEVISLGQMSLTFLETRMLHWPDSMFAYLKEREILFTQDAFGMHLACERMFSDELEYDVLHRESEKYFANIRMPYGPQVLKLLEHFGQLNLPVRMIAPDHGPLHRGDWIGRMMGWYREWSEQKSTTKAVLVFDSMWESTATMATAIAEGLREEGITVKLMNLSSCHRSDVVTEILDAGALVVGTPTINNQMFPSVADMLCYLRGLRPKNLLGGVFGSFGWSGEAIGQVSTIMTDMGIPLVGTGLKVKYVPTHADLMVCNNYGREIGIELKKTVAASNG